MAEASFVAVTRRADEERELVSKIGKHTLSRLTLADQDVLYAKLELLDWTIRDLLDSMSAGKWRADGRPIARNRSPTNRVEFLATAYAAAVMTP